MKAYTMMLVMLALGLALGAAGCKKKGAEPEKSAVKKSEAPAGEKPAAEAPAKKPVEETAKEPPVAAEEEQPAEQVADVEPEEPGEEAGEEKAAEGAEEKPADVTEATPAEGTPDEPPAEETEGDVQGTEEPRAEGDSQPAASGDVVAEAPDVAEAEVPEGHYGRPFKLEAIMMLNDVVKYPDHYGTFETVKLRGEVLSIVGDLMLLGFRNKDGLWVFLTRFTDAAPGEMEVGRIVVVEGKVQPEEWDMGSMGAIKMEEGEKLEASYKYVLAVEAGEKENP